LDTEAWGTGTSKTAIISLTKPSASTVALGDSNGAFTAATDSVFSTTGMTTGLGSAMATGGGLGGPATGTVAAGAVVAGTVTITPDVPGTYTVVITTDNSGTPVTAVATIYAYTTATNGATLVGLLADGGLPSNNAAINAVAGAANTVKVRAFPNTTSDIRRLITVSGAGAYISAQDGETVTLAAGTEPKSGTIASNADASAHSDLTIVTPTVGTITMSIFNESAASSGIFSGTATATVTITVNATASATTLSVGNSSVFASDASGTPGTAATEAALTPRAGTGAVAFAVRFDINVKDTLNNAMPSSSTSLTAVVSGPGLLNTSNSTSGVTRVVAPSWSGSALQVYLFNDGTAGEATVTFNWGSTVLAAKKVSFYGSAKTLTAGALKPHITTAAASGENAIWVLALDAAGIAVPYASPVGTSSASNIVGSAITGCDVASTAEQADGAPKGSYVCDVSGVAKGTATLTIAQGSTTTNAPTVALRVTLSVAASVTLTTDKPVYAPGEKITLTITAKDADGFLLGAGDYGLLAGANTVSQALTGTAFSNADPADITINAGVAETTYFAPLVSGPFTFNATVKSGDADVASAIQGTKLAVTATVENPESAAATDAANEATDAANAATDAALAAADAADAATAAAQDAADAVAALSTRVSKLVSDLRKQINALTKLVKRLL
jgi:hypothetical protein